MAMKQRKRRPTLRICLGKKTTFAISVVLLVARLVSSSNQTTPSSFDYYASLLASKNISHERDANVDVLYDPATDKEYGICHLVALYAFSTPNTYGVLQSLGSSAFEDLAALSMAVYHFNTGNGTVVKEIEGINDRCPIRFTAEFLDTEFGLFAGLQQMASVVTRNEGETRNNTLDACAIIGTSRSAVTEPTASLSSVQNLAQMSFHAIASDLNDPTQYPYFSRVIPDDEAAAEVVVRYLTQVENVYNVAVLNVDDAFGNSYAKAFQKYAILNGISMDSFPFAFDGSSSSTTISFRQALQAIKNMQYRYIFAIIFDGDYERIMLEAHSMGLTGPQYRWLFGGEGLSDLVNSKTYPVGSALDLATRGNGFLVQVGGVAGQPGYDRFVAAWSSLNSDDVKFFNSKMPSSKSDSFQRYQAPPGLFRQKLLSSAAPFAYDTVIAMGMAACDATTRISNGMDINGTSSYRYFGGDEHHGAIINLPEFEGASGTVKTDNETRSRVPQTAFYALFNAVPNFQNVASRSSSGTVTYSMVECSVYQPSDNGTAWKYISLRPFIYADGTTTPPPPLPPSNIDKHYFGKLVYFGGIVCGIIWVLCLSFATWIGVNRKIRIVRASQPSFLIMICVGVFIFGSAIIPQSIDDQNFSEKGCDIACMAMPWLITLGFTIAFSSLFSKTWRVNKIFHNPARFQRIKVKEKDVMFPFIILLVVNITVLTCWTAIAPISYVREYSAGTDQFNRPLSSHAVCRNQSDAWGGSTPYMVLLGVTNFLVVVLANVQSYQARNIRTEFSESRYVALAQAGLLQSWLVGVPILFLVYDQPQADYTVRVLLILVTCMSMLLFIFIPKVALTRKYQAELQEKEAKKKAKQEARDAAARDQVAHVPAYSDGASSDDTGAGLKIIVVKSGVDGSQKLVVENEDGSQKLVVENEDGSQKLVVENGNDHSYHSRHGSLPPIHEQYVASNEAQQGENEARSLVPEAACDGGR